MESFSSPKSRVWVMRENFIKNTFVNIFDFVNESQSLTRKVSTVKKEVRCCSTKFPHLHKGFIASAKLCRNFCYLRLLKPTRNLVKSFIPFALCTLNMLFASGLMKFNRCFQKYGIACCITYILI